MHPAANSDTAVSWDKLQSIGVALSTPPHGTAVHPKIERQLKERADAIRSGEGISWAFVEALAFATLTREGRNVRFSEQDTPRGALSQRRFIVIDQETGVAVNPCNQLQPSQGREIIGSSRKIYYDLLAQMTALNVRGMVLVRVEQLYPFPADLLQAELARFRDAEVIWCQEEPNNMGAWSFVDRKIESILRNIGNTCQWPHCVSRPANASTAIGTSDEHAVDQARLVACAINIAGS
jgi:2-oxoglutarate dehydrogenase complex dehydrogenase (E1) component-like enzyme